MWQNSNCCGNDRVLITLFEADYLAQADLGATGSATGFGAHTHRNTCCCCVAGQCTYLASRLLVLSYIFRVQRVLFTATCGSIFMRTFML